MQKKVIKCLEKIENPYKLNVGDMSVEVIYSKNNKKLDECLLNILKGKINRN